MRWAKAGRWLGVWVATTLAACGGTGHSSYGGVGVGGGANGGTGVVTGGTIGVAGTPPSGGQPTGLDACGASALRFPVIRYSVADVDSSLDLVFGAGPRLADAFSEPASLGVRDSVGFVRALLGVARSRVVEAATDAAELEPCDEDEAEDASCVQTWLRSYGAKLYRRPLEPQQLAGYVAPFRAAEGAAERTRAAEDALVSMLLSPYFALRLESATDGVLDGYGIAARLAHFATRSVPDADLTAAAAGGRLADPLERLSQLHRLWGTPAGRVARTRFALELLDVPEPSERSDLDAALLRELSAQTQALVNQVYEDDFGSFRALLGTSRLPLNDLLADFYRVAQPGSDELVPTQLDPQLFAGILTSGAFTTARTRPSLRGVAIVERLLCTPVPTPPIPHDFSLPAGVPPRDGLAQTAGANPACSACHRLFDPTGLALAAFDASGQLSGLDSSGGVSLSGSEPISVANPAQLAEAIAGSDAARLCLQRRYLEHVVGRELQTDGSLVRALPAPGSAPSPAISAPDSQWLSCMANVLGDSETNLTLLSEAIVQSDLMRQRADTPRHVVALDSNSDPIEHALAETEQLLGSYVDVDDNDAISLYLAALQFARDAAPPAGAGGDGAGGAP